MTAPIGRTEAVGETPAASAFAADPLVRVAVGSGVELYRQSEIDAMPFVFPCDRCGMQSMSHLCDGRRR